MEAYCCAKIGHSFQSKRMRITEGEFYFEICCVLLPFNLLGSSGLLLPLDGAGISDLIKIKNVNRCTRKIFLSERMAS